MAMEGLVVRNIGEPKECKDDPKNKRSRNRL
jgi:hypothetical protein